MIRPYVVAWFVMLVLAFANAALRETVLTRWLTPDRARQLSTLTLLIAFAIVIYVLANRWPFRSGPHALVIGLSWAAATVAFEILLGQITGQSWDHILAAYDITRGSAWPLVPLFLAVGPYVYYRAS